MLTIMKIFGGWRDLSVWKYQILGVSSPLLE